MKLYQLNFLIFVFLISFSSRGDSDGITQLQAKHVIASLMHLEKFTKGDGSGISEDEKEAINDSVRNIITRIGCDDFNPMNPMERTSELKTQGTCCTWHEFGCLDNRCWGLDLLILLWGPTSTWCDGKSKCCEIISIMTVGAWPLSNLVCAAGAGLAQGGIWLASLPFRLCGDCNEYEDKLQLNIPLLQQFVQYSAIEVANRIAQNKEIKLTNEEQAALARLQSRPSH